MTELERALDTAERWRLHSILVEDQCRRLQERLNDATVVKLEAKVHRLQRIAWIASLLLVAVTLWSFVLS